VLWRSHAHGIKEQKIVSKLFVVLAAVAVATAACDKTAGQAAGPGGGRGGRGGRGAAVATQVTAVQRMSVQREVELSGTLLSPDQAKISS